MNRVTNGVRRGLAATAAAPGLLVPRLAEACPACFAASAERVSRMYLVSGLLLSLLPLAIIGGIAWWCRRRFAAEAQA